MSGADATQNKETSLEEMNKNFNAIRLVDDNPLIEASDIPDADNDHFKFLSFIDTFTRIASTKDNRTPLTVVIDGKWGTGKTTLMKLTQKELNRRRKIYNIHRKSVYSWAAMDAIERHSAMSEAEKEYEAFTNNQRPCMTFFFNPWKYSSEEHVLASLLLEIFHVMEEDANFWDAIKTKVDYRNVLVGLINSFSKKYTGKDSSDFFHELKIAQKASFLDEFTRLVRSLIINYCSKSQEKKDDEAGAFVFFIDDLDRCRPDKVLQVLETLKLFLDIPGCIFFLGMDVDAVKEVLKHKFAKEEGRTNFSVDLYLEKFIQIHVKIPDNIGTSMIKYIEHIFSSKLGITSNDDTKKYEHVKKMLSKAGFETQRSVKRSVNDYFFMENLAEKMEEDVTIHAKEDSALAAVKAERNSHNHITRQGLMKWIILNNSNLFTPEFRSQILDDKDMFLLSAWEMSLYRVKSINGDLDFDGSEWDGFTFTKAESTKNGKPAPSQNPSDESATAQKDDHTHGSDANHKKKDRFLRWEEFKTNWKDYSDSLIEFMTCHEAPSFNNERLCKSYKHINQYVATNESVVETSKQEEKSMRRGYNLKPGADLQGLSFVGENFYGVDLSGAKLNSAILKNIIYKNGKFEGAVLNNADLSGANLTGCNFDGAKLINANFNDAILNKASFIGADLSWADFTKACWGKTVFINAVTDNVKGITSKNIPDIIGYDPTKKVKKDDDNQRGEAQ